MRILRSVSGVFRGWLLMAVLPLGCLGADLPKNVVAQYQFVGASELAKGTNLASAKAVFRLKSTEEFESMAAFHIAQTLAKALRLQTNELQMMLLRPLLQNALKGESIAAFGGTPGQPISGFFAFQLTPEQIQLWQGNLKAANPATPEPLALPGATGWQWRKGSNDSMWTAAAGNWLFIGRGDELDSLRAQYLRQIEEKGRPVPALDYNCFEADIDWPRWAQWFSMDSCPLKLGRMQIAISDQPSGFHMVSHVTYPQPIEWQPPIMYFPTNLVREPLVSFCTGQNVAPFLKSDETLGKFCTDPFRDQFYFWSMRALSFQNYVAWPALDPTNTIKTLAQQAMDALNPVLKNFNQTELKWFPQAGQLVWGKFDLIEPNIHTVGATNGDFLVAGTFGMSKGAGPAPGVLWSQLAGRNDLIYYDWEFTGPRVKNLLTVTEVIPVLRMLGIGPNTPGALITEPAKPGAKEAQKKLVDPRLSIEEAWLANLSRFLGNTVTEVTKTGPNEVTIVRNSPFVFSSLELLLLSHWLSDTPSGPLDMALLQRAKMSGPGVPK